MKRILAAACALMLAGALSATADASHPTQICLDVEPDTWHATSNDDMVDSLRAYVGATDAGHPPEQEGCVIGNGSGSGSTVDFEIEGVSDPDDSFSPETPDLTCTIGESDDLCTVDPPPSGGGGQTIWAWIDFDQDDSTVELDLNEQQSDEDTDATDVAEWTWTHADPPPPPECNDGIDNDNDGMTDYPDDSDCATADDTFEGTHSDPGGTCSNGADDDGDGATDHDDSGCKGGPTDNEGRFEPTVTIAYRRGSFKGSVDHEVPRCSIPRKVVLKRRKATGSRVIGHDLTNDRGNWRFDDSYASGRYFAVAVRKETTDGWGDPYTCRRDASPTIRV